ncbi:MAG: Na+/H+ antiporter NhaC family protein [Calditrichaeota bacterium]|nr:Na+/H+ antiporter NhaC family protein [Calditrichota bacterium]
MEGEPAFRKVGSRIFEDRFTFRGGFFIFRSMKMKTPHVHSRMSFFLLFLVMVPALFSQSAMDIQPPRIVLTGIAFKIEAKPGFDFLMRHAGDTLRYAVLSLESGQVMKEGTWAVGADTETRLVISDLVVHHTGRQALELRVENVRTVFHVRAIPAVLSILPPLLAILLALLTRQVIIALFFGIWMGVTFIYDYNVVQGFLHTLDEYLVQSLADADRVSILIFTLVLGGMVGVITRSGGTQGIVEALSRYARNSRLGQLATWAMGVLIFFDDYANTLIVGNTMRPLADRLRISREKLSYLVDSTAAPVANIAIISTWIGYEVSLIAQSFQAMGMEGNAYITFIRTIPYNYYPLYALLFGFAIALMGRDFGPMRKAEQRARSTGKVLRDGAVPLMDLSSLDVAADASIEKRWYNALIPIGVVILVVSAGLFYSGSQALSQQGISLEGKSWFQQLSVIVGNANSFAVLMWASFSGSIVAIGLALSQRLINLHQTMDAWVMGIRSMIMAAIILTAAWTIGTICQELFTADYVIHLTRKFLTPHWLPLVTFLSAGAISFATGTSWGTMAILMPIAIPLAHKFPLIDPSIDAAHAMGLLLSTTAAVLAGATFGDHCSPISDTTIMSSMASGADHIDHVRTQLPYAVTTAGIAILFGYLPTGFLGWSPWLTLPLGGVATILVVRFLGRRSNDHTL